MLRFSFWRRRSTKEGSDTPEEPPASAAPPEDASPAALLPAAFPEPPPALSPGATADAPAGSENAPPPEPPPAGSEHEPPPAAGSVHEPAPPPGPSDADRAGTSLVGPLPPPVAAVPGPAPADAGTAADGTFALAPTFGFAADPPASETGLVPVTPNILLEPLPPERLDAPVRQAFRVLIADDDAATVALVRHRLMREGFEVDDCAEGDDALRRAFDEPGYDLILANTLLAGLDGYGILRHVRAAGLPVHVVLMGHQGDEQAVVRAFALGAQDFIPKPFSPIELLARLARVLSLPRG